MRERETKLLVDPEFDLPDLDGLVDGVVLTGDDFIDQHAVYFDTADLRLTHSGASLRYRSDDGWTVKLPESLGASELIRTEHSFSGGAESPPAGAVDLVRAWIRTEPLEAVASVTTRRHRFRLTDRDGRPLVEIDDDRVETVSRDGVSATFREIEIELDERAPSALGKRLAKRLHHAGAKRTSSLPKVARALNVRDVAWHQPVSHFRRKHVSMEQFIEAILEDAIHRLLAHDPMIRIDENVEAVHQARVATRKLRSDLRTFAPVLEPRSTDHLRGELGWIGGVLGRVRDADVLGELLRTTASALPEARGDGAHEILEALAAQRARAHDELLAAMRSPRYAALLDALVEAIRNPQLRAGSELQPARQVVPSLATKQWHRLRRVVGRLGDDPTDPELHKARRRAKQARYALEAASPFADRASARAERAEDLQQFLGENQDCVVARRWLFDAAVDQPAHAFVAGELAGRLGSEHTSVRADALHRLHRFAKK